MIWAVVSLARSTVSMAATWVLVRAPSWVLVRPVTLAVVRPAIRAVLRSAAVMPAIWAALSLARSAASMAAS
ncbi:hypothetical protein D3C81_1889610 [compost metagenome]